MHLGGITIIGTILSLLVGFVVAQTDTKLRSPETKQSNAAANFVSFPPEAKAILQKSCSDCHSNDTRWTWYSYVPFFGARVQSDVRKARGRMNLSDWPALAREGQDEVIGRVIAVCEEVELQNMPPARYLWLHPDARLTSQDRKTLCAWSQTTQRELERRASVGTSHSSSPTSRN